MLTTPEQIEALPSDAFLLLSQTAADLHEGTVGVLDMQSPADVGIQQELRSSMKLKLDEAMSNLSKQIADLEALKRDLRIRKGYQASDHDRIESHKISLYVARKEGRA